MNEIDIYDTEYVRNVFDRVSNIYGYTNYIASFGFTERWRKQCISKLSELPQMASGFDLMSGRGETWTQLFSKHPTISKLTGLDISPEMIKRSKEQAENIDSEKISLMEIDVFENKIPSDTADFLISTFGVKTFSLEQQKILATEVHRILKRGGKFSFVEVSHPKDWIFAGLYMFYLERAMPIIEKLFLGYSYGFSMIGVYVSRFGDCKSFCSFLETVGLEVTYHKYFFGCATGVSGVKK